MCSYRSVIAVVISAMMFLSAHSMAQESKSELPNDVSIELLGRCIIYSFSYERMVTHNLGIEMGASLLGGSGGSVAFLSAGGRLYALRGNASPCISGGIVVVTASTGSGPFSSDNSASYGYIGPGFEYRSLGGFVFRGTVYCLVRDGFFVWPGVQLGIAF
jgi:hypothetical protein